MDIAIKKGIFGRFSSYDKENKFHNLLSSMFSPNEMQKLLEHNQKVAKNIQGNNKMIIKTLQNVYNQDQTLRKNKVYEKCKRYAFSLRLGFPIDTNIDHENAMKCFHEFKNLDSLILMPFIKIIDSLGYVPKDETIFGLVDLSILICHTSHFKFEINLDQIYLNSLHKGTINPQTYAWYKGYNEEYYKKEHHLYFTANSKTILKFTDSKISQINDRRKAIGLQICPSVIWNTILY